ncbi:hypothetical protein KC622_02330 [Candidatus Dojkabacteria bacterium]|uniref:Uncharacterized protein n=1 Tax=Candidatus Dojkabacteria bacterium TaxID=2099670 RepID=A0A955HYX5_9BACT|nr:hypothetical protein [Candidatus Dojkabacteria bacterium]
MNTSTSTGYVLDIGKTNLLVSAPHCIEHKRPNVTGALRPAEESTKEISEEICNLTGASLIYATDSNLSYDPNYMLISDNPYKQAMKKIVRKKKVPYVLDIHGLSDKHNYDIAIFYPDRFFKSKKYAFSLAKAVLSGKLKDALIQIFPQSNLDRETITQFCAGELNTPANQIEIAKYIRQDDLLCQDLIKSISSFLLNL